jgi:hypothetical protein
MAPAAAAICRLVDGARSAIVSNKPARCPMLAISVTAAPLSSASIRSANASVVA